MEVMSDERQTMLPECNVHFAQNTSEHVEIRKYIHEVELRLTATMVSNHVAQTAQFSSLDKHLRNGITAMLSELNGRAESHAATLKVIWALIVVMLTGLLGVAWAHFS